MPQDIRITASAERRRPPATHSEFDRFSTVKINQIRNSKSSTTGWKSNILCAHFVDIIKEGQVQTHDIVVSFDVISLFTRIIIERALHLIKGKYNRSSYLINLLEHCISILIDVLEDCLFNTYFTYSNQRYD